MVFTKASVSFKLAFQGRGCLESVPGQAAKRHNIAPTQEMQKPRPSTPVLLHHKVGSNEPDPFVTLKFMGWHWNRAKKRREGK